jgi:hypothetical protein
MSCSFCIFPKLYFSKVGNISKIVKFHTDHKFGLGFEIFHHLGNVVNQQNYVKLQIGMLINGLYRARILIALVLELLLNSYSVNQKPRTIKSYFMNIQYTCIVIIKTICLP